MTVKIDYDSIPRSYREYLELMVKEGKLTDICDLMQKELGKKMKPFKLYKHLNMQGSN